MIEVVITKRVPGEEPEELAYIKIINVSDYEAKNADMNLGDYTAQFATERCGAVGLHRRIVRGFPRTKYNALALVRQALATLQPYELELESDVGPSDLARRQRRPGRALPR